MRELYGRTAEKHTGPGRRGERQTGAVALPASAPSAGWRTRSNGRLFRAHRGRDLGQRLLGGELFG